MALIGGLFQQRTFLHVRRIRIGTGANDAAMVQTPAAQSDILYQQQHLGTTGIGGGQTFHEIVEDIKAQFRAVGQWLRHAPASWHRAHVP